VRTQRAKVEAHDRSLKKCSGAHEALSLRFGAEQVDVVHDFLEDAYTGRKRIHLTLVAVS
jgi:hypothetical protein